MNINTVDSQLRVEKHDELFLLLNQFDTMMLHLSRGSISIWSSILKHTKCLVEHKAKKEEEESDS